MRKILLIDDLRRFRVPPTDAKVTTARNSKDALAILQADADWDEIWLDHDLGQDRYGIVDSIMSVVDYLSERAFDEDPIRVKQVLVHTSNPVGRAQIIKALERYGYAAKPVQAEIYFIV